MSQIVAAISDWTSNGLGKISPSRVNNVSIIKILL